MAGKMSRYSSFESDDEHERFPGRRREPLVVLIREVARRCFRALGRFPPLVTLVLLAHPSGAAATARVEDIQVSSDVTNVYVTIRLSSPVFYAASTIEADEDRPDRIYIDLAETVLATGGVTRWNVNAGLVRSIRARRLTSETARVVLDLASPAMYTVETHRDPDRIVLGVGVAVPAERGRAAQASTRPPGWTRSEFLIAKGQAAARAGRDAEAHDFFTDALAVGGPDPMAFYGLGFALAKLGRWSEAARAFENALALQPGFSDAQQALGAASYHRGVTALDDEEFDRAAELFHRAAGLSPVIAERARYYAGLAETRAGKAREARADFEAAASAPSRDIADAARAAVAKKNWEIRAATGVQYDSNVTLAPRNGARLHNGDEGDAAFLFGVRLRYDLLNSHAALLRLDYDLYQTLHADLDDLDLRGNRVRATASYRLHPVLWAGIHGGYNHHALGTEAYLEEPFVMPFISLSLEKWGLAQVVYRHGELDYLSPPFDSILDRDGPLDSVGVTQSFSFTGGERHLTLGYEFSREKPRSSAGNDYDFLANQAYVGIRFRSWAATAIELLYLYRNYDYRKPNSQVDFRRSRSDNQHRMYAGVKRGFGKYLSLTLSYSGTVNSSNISVFDYRRSIVTLMFEAAY